MGTPTSVLRGARAFARDYPRDVMPPGYLWDVVDFVPQIVDASLTGRGGWVWASNVLGGDVETGILANFLSGEQLLVQDAASRLSQIDTSSMAVTDRGAIARGLQNPVQVFEKTVWLDGSGATVPSYVASSGGPVALDPTAAKARYGTIWSGYLMVGNVPGKEDTLFFSPAGPVVTGAWDVNAFQQTSTIITGLAAIRSLGLIFHASSVERLRGTLAPNTASGDPGDLTLEPLFARVGCPDARAIAYWNENVLFADEHGVHITDGAVVRNLAQQGGISSYWRPLYQNRQTLAATTFQDYYAISITRTDGSADTLVCDLNQRQWFRFSNVKAICYIDSGGSSGMERIWASIKGSKRLGRVSPCFYPILGSTGVADADGTAVMPFVQTPWYRLGPEGKKRIRFAYLSYDARIPGTVLSASPGAWRAELGPEEGPVLASPPPRITDVAAPVLSLGYIRSPQDASYTSLGNLPGTTAYQRFRLPINQFPYGAAFQISQTASTSVLRIFDFALEAMGAERSNL